MNAKGGALLHNRLKRLAAIVAFVVAGLAPYPVEATRIKVFLDNRSMALKSVKVDGAEYLPLAHVAKALGAQTERLSRRGKYQIRLQSSSISLAIGSPEVLVGKRHVMLPVSPRRVGRRVVVPIDLLPIALSARYGEGRVNWDPEAHVARLGPHAHSLRLLRVRTYADHTRVVLEGTQRHDFVLKEDKTTGRVVLEVKQASLSPSIRSSQVNDGLIASIEPRQNGPDGEIVIQAAGRQIMSKAFALERPDRIVVDLLPVGGQTADGSQPAAQTFPSNGAPREAAPAATHQITAPDLLPPPDSVKIVLIDPGHGGRDTGAIGPSGVKEKDVVLDLGLRLKRLIERNLGLKVIMTRSKDVFVPLEERTAIANRHKADFFISLHVNAAPKSRAVGFETYFLSREPSDRGARASAIRENMVLNLEGVGPEEQGSLKTVLWDLAQTFYTRESSELAELLLNELGRILKADNRGVKSAPFFVLIGAAMPSVLVEVAFVTNPSEERKLDRQGYRQQIAEALLAGIAKFKTRFENRVGLMPSRGAS